MWLLLCEAATTLASTPRRLATAPGTKPATARAGTPGSSIPAAGIAQIADCRAPGKGSGFVLVPRQNLGPFRCGIGDWRDSSGP